MSLPEKPVVEIDVTCNHGYCKGVGTYVMPGRCSNCGAEYRVKITKGHDKPSFSFGATCPNCGCQRVGC